MHPVAMLTVELFELHDRDRFEVFVFDWSREDGSALRQRIKQAADHFVPIQQLNDEDAAKLIRQHEIDVLIDLQGQTLGARPNMLAYRPARVQVTYLGLPATTGLPSIDYVIADKYLIPQDAQRFYSEMAVYLPDVYQSSDRQREHAPAQPRSAYGLPEHAFVFCCFNNNYKITPEVFSTWMNVLQEVPTGVLWLLADNAWAEENLRRSALARGIDDRRLVFTHRSLPQDYLAKYLAADLFLDCYPFNGGTTANDALWMGTPVLTLSGQTFASRMAGALLTAAGLPELITTTLNDYQALAVGLANDPQRFAEIKRKLVEQNKNGVLFDTPRLVKNLEQSLYDLAQRHD
jgi:predicted O-linked N-acetylglucosamine transferase (SPINDLY family)